MNRRAFANLAIRPDSTGLRLDEAFGDKGAKAESSLIVLGDTSQT
jgi:hypothetical protein